MTAQLISTPPNRPIPIRWSARWSATGWRYWAAATPGHSLMARSLWGDPLDPKFAGHDLDPGT
jgi:hypothetical protein